MDQKYIWETLNSYNIYTEEDLKEALKNNQLDIGFFTTALEQ